jgi:hypothetical protein
MSRFSQEIKTQLEEAQINPYDPVGDLTVFGWIKEKLKLGRGGGGRGKLNAISYSGDELKGHGVVELIEVSEGNRSLFLQKFPGDTRITKIVATRKAPGSLTDKSEITLGKDGLWHPPHRKRGRTFKLPL